MNSNIELYGSETIDRLEAMTERARRALVYTLPLVKQGLTEYVENCHAKMFALAGGEWVLPLVVNESHPNNADVCSPMTHFVEYPLHELTRHGSAFGKPLLWAAAAVLRACRLDEVVYVNNWLLATNPSPRLSADQVGRITAFLQERFPTRAILFPNVNRLTDPESCQALRGSQYKLVPSRIVYLYTPTTSVLARHRNLHIDRKLAQASPYRIISAQELTPEDIARMTQLYRALYLDRHTRLNPQYTTQFFSHLLRENLLTFLALKQERTDAFAAYSADDSELISCLLGYDLSLPTRLGLYRQALALFFREAEREGKRLNLSAGAGEFKALRGALPCVEYYAVYDRHLPPRRRLGWWAVWAGGIVQHYKVRKSQRPRGVAKRDKLLSRYLIR